MITIYYTKVTEELPKDAYNIYLHKLPIEQQVRNTRFFRWQDRHFHLFGRMLLLEGLKKVGYKEDVLFKIKYTNHNRPYLEGDIDFSISHSGNYVACAIANGFKIGCDIERIKEIDFNDFKNVMTAPQWQEINQSEDPQRTFFKYWTLKESVIKADGRGLFIPLNEVRLNKNKATCQNITWYLSEIEFDNDHCMYLAIDKDVKHQNIFFCELLFN